jgi:hypothetical protein
VTLVYTYSYPSLLYRCTAELSVVCIAISAGLALTSWGETSVSLFGAALVLLAGCMGGLRWIALSHTHSYRSSMFKCTNLSPHRDPYKERAVCEPFLALKKKKIVMIVQLILGSFHFLSFTPYTTSLTCFLDGHSANASCTCMTN